MEQYDPEALLAEAKRISKAAWDEYKTVADQAAVLRERAQAPSVVPVVIWRPWHGPTEHEPMELGDTELSALHSLNGYPDADAGSPIGVSVGGAFTSWGDLMKQYPED